MSYMRTVAKGLYLHLNSLTAPWTIPDIDERFGVARRNLFKDLPAHPLINCVTPERQRNRKYILIPCSEEAFLEYMPGGKTRTHTVSGAGDIIEVKRQVTDNRTLYNGLTEFAEYLPKWLRSFQMATENYEAAPEIQFEVQPVKKFADYLENWLENYMADPRCSEADTRYPLFILED